jgi:CRISPR-associated endonuclease/helicase Cas3
MVIAGHHSGLPRKATFEDDRLKRPEKQARLRAARAGGAPADLLAIGIPPLPDFLRPEAFVPTAEKREKILRHEFWTRMLLSALIDADRLDTERFMDARRAGIRRRSKGLPDHLVKLRIQLDKHLDELAEQARRRVSGLTGDVRDRATSVLDLRSNVLDACRKAATLPPGRFSLTVPTGGGKTLAALAFALAHAIRHDLRRVIVVIPFTSIIDQTARVYRDAFGRLGRPAVVEHHSNLEPQRETVANRLASENWDAPVVVTTSVQFFESLFSCRGTAARKLHNIARSVVIFDEVQTLPHDLRAPIFDALNQLVDHYGVSALFCTATQPALGMAKTGRDHYPHLEAVNEVILNVPATFAAVGDRVVVEFPPTDAPPTTWNDLAQAIAKHTSVLAIVQRRDDARDLCLLLPDDTFHLSGLMCAAHRRDVLAKISETLKAGRPCRVTSTTLVEAGVDLDFPVVYRALGGVDALAQAAGRCNREGRLCDHHGRPIPGRMIIFDAPTPPPKGLRLTRATTHALLTGHGNLDLFDPKTYDIYFAAYLANILPDRPDVMGARADRDFPETEQRFRMIDDGGQVSVVVPYGDASQRIDAYRADPSRRTLRALQPYIVNIPQERSSQLEKANLIETIHDQVRWLRMGDGPQYDPRFGLIVDQIVPLPPGGLIVDDSMP